MTTIQFLNVGRHKLSWKAELESTDEESIAKAVRASNALLSSSITCEAGHIYAGFRLVGTYKMLGEELGLSA